MPSPKYQIVEKIIPLTGAKRMLAKEGEAFYRMVWGNVYGTAREDPKGI